jgi:hypothetical protein
MAVDFMTPNAANLLKLFKARIEQQDLKGKITTWMLSDDGNDFTHKADNWKYAAWFQPAVKNDRLTFNIIKTKGKNVSTVAYSYYHGHLIETFLNHFDTKFSQAIATAMPTSGDLVS